MAKLIRKIRPGNHWQLAEHESWLQDMAAKGLHLKKLTNVLGYFEQGERMEKAFKIELTKKMKLSANQMEKCEQLGRNHVFSYTRAFLTYHIFSMPTNQQITELVVDIEEYETAMDSLISRLVWNAIFGIVGLVAILVAILALIMYLGTPIYMLVTGTNSAILLLLFNSASLIFSSISSLKGIRAIKDKYSTKQYDNECVDWEPSYHRQKIVSILFIGFTVLCVGIPIIQILKMDTKTLPNDGQALPIVRLADFEQNSNLINDTYTTGDDVNWSSYYSSEWGPLTPIQYEAYEVLTDSQTGYRPNLSTKIYQLRFERLAEPFFDDLVKRQNEILQHKDFTELEHPAFDRLLVYDNKQILTIYAMKGRAVTAVDYHGESELEAILESLEKRLRSLSN